MADATLREVIDVLKMNRLDNRTAEDTRQNQLNQLTQSMETLTSLIQDQGQDRIRELERMREEAREKQGEKVKAQSNQNSGNVFNKGALGMLGGTLAGMGMLLKGGGVGLGAMGAGIGAFFMGLAGAEAIMTKFGTGENLKKMMVNLSEGLASFSTRDLAALGALLGTGALFGAVGGPSSGVGAGVGVGMMGVGIAAFFSALGAGDMALGMMESTAENLSVFLGNLGEGLSKLGTDEMIALGTVMGASAALGAFFGVGKAVKAGIGIAAVGAGIAAFFGALGAGDMAIGLMESTGANLATFMGNISAGFSAMDPEAMNALVVAMGAGGAFAAFFGVGAAAKGAIGMALMGAGLAAGLAAMAGVTKLAIDAGFGEGNEFKTLATNIAAGLSEFSTDQMNSLGILMMAGGGIGAFLGVGAASTAAIGIALVGAGIGGFLSGLAGATKLAEWMGVDGSSFKNLSANIAGGLAEWNTIEPGLMEKVGGLAGLGPALLAFMSTTGIAGIADALTENFYKAWNWLTGGDAETDPSNRRKGQIAAMVDSLQPLKNLDADMLKNLSGVTNQLSEFANALGDMTAINVDRLKNNFQVIGESMAIQVGILHAAATGGKFDPSAGWFNEIRFKKSIFDPDLRLDEMAAMFQKIRFVFGSADSPYLKPPGGGMGDMTMSEFMALQRSRDQQLLAAITNNQDNSVTDNGDKVNYSSNAPIWDIDDPMRPQ